jgi:uncharacterized protein
MHKSFIFALLLVAFNAHASPASRESVEKLLSATKAESLMDSMYGGIEQMMRQGMSQSLQGKSLGPEQQRILDAVPTKFTTVMRQEMSWEKLKPSYIQIYQETFEQDEVDGLNAFYASPAGQAYVSKMPVVLQKSMALSQTLMQSLIPKMKAVMNEAMAEAKEVK